jgi:flagella basal body P-ring formation protein FlgA
MSKSANTLLVLFALGCSARFAPAQTPACQPIAADQVIGRDLAAALPAFHALPPDILLANVPPPGSKRILHPPELLSIAKRYSIELETPSDVCFEWPLARLDRDRVLEAMRQSLAIPDARIELADLSLVPAPPGRIEFPTDRLGTPAAAGLRTPVLWRGDVVYGADHRFAIWARVRISAPCTRIVAAENIAAGQPVEARQVHAAAAECFPMAARLTLTIEQVVGTRLRRPVSMGAELVPDLLATPKDVNRGDSVAVEVLSGAAHLEFTGKAETAGSTGDFIAVRNLSSNRIFQARVNGKGKAVVEIPESR